MAAASIEAVDGGPSCSIVVFLLVAAFTVGVVVVVGEQVPEAWGLLVVVVCETFVTFIIDVFSIQNGPGVGRNRGLVNRALRWNWATTFSGFDYRTVGREVRPPVAKLRAGRTVESNNMSAIGTIKDNYLGLIDDGDVQADM